MNIAIVAREFAPYSGVGADGDKIRDLVAWLVRKDMKVRVIAPMPAAERASEFSLARRLMPVQVSVNGAVQKWFRFDGRTATGAEVNLLLPDVAVGESDASAGFGPAAEAVIASFPEPFDSLIAWNNVTTFESIESRVQTVSIIDDDNVALDCSGIFDRILIHGRRRASRLLAGDTPLSLMLDINDAAVVPRWVPDATPLTRDEKLSAKAMFQSTFGLPVRPDIPLVFLDDTAARAERLAAILTRNIQVCVKDSALDPDTLERFSNNYPDRFAVLPARMESTAMIAPADFGVFESDAFCARLAVSLGTLPLCTAEMLDGAVDLSPDLSSGSCVLFGTPPERSFQEAISRALASYSQPGFAAVPAAIQRYSVSLSRVAEIYTALLSHQAPAQ